jgi:spore coat polysaccharide biosynthesis protein SpsF
MARGGLLVVIQARMGSTRLPGKVLADLGGRPALALQLERLSGLRCDHLAVATSDLPGDDAIAALAGQMGVEVVRGSESDVLGRFGLAVERFDPDDLVRLTGDCPLSDPAVVERTVALHRSAGADYTSNIQPRSFPKGLDVEVATRAAFDAAVEEATDPYEREHVMPFLYRRPHRFDLANLTSGLDAGDEWWTLDTPEDLDRLRTIAAAVPDIVQAPWREILASAGHQGRADPSP